ncbi:MAG: carotenoid 1,2-hydratase, partial [Acetobacteraceae bacterium]|nr:carotenoid 1,2-hydratase [Acetobacteraceae bacterium]
VAWMAGLVQTDGGARNAGPVSGGGQRAPGPGRADGGDLGTTGGGGDPRGLGFDAAVPENGYAWWYVDAVSNDGAHALTIIAFIGSVFSPYYALARTRGRGDPENHVAINVALYGRPSAWSMTERGRNSLRRSMDGVEIGTSAMRRNGDTLTISIDETTCPVPSRLIGAVTVTPRMVQNQTFLLDGDGQHRWRPIAPACDVGVAFTRPDLSWSGSGYFDRNSGDAPLESAFRSWTWSRFHIGQHTRIFYDVVQDDGTERRLSLAVDPKGTPTAASSLACGKLKPGLWRVERWAPVDAGYPAKLLTAFEDAPFYTRSKIRSRIDGVEAEGIHESLSLSRLRAPLVRLMLPFRMPRNAAGRLRPVDPV